MKKLVLALIAFNLALALGAQSSVEVTYVANDGFLISGGSKAVLIDALFNAGFGAYDVPSDEMRKAVVDGAPPFGRIDLYLVTHLHGDHFYAPYVIDLLKSHPETRLLGPRQAVEAMPRDGLRDKRVRALDLGIGERTRLKARGIPLEIFRLKHYRDIDGDKVVSLAYLMTVGGLKLLHLGDAPIEFNQPFYDRLGLEREKIDVLFLGYSDVSEAARRFVRDTVKPTWVIAMHIPPKDIEVESKNFPAAYPNGLVFGTAGETKTLTARPRAR